MSLAKPNRIFILGGTGAQGLPVVRALSAAGYSTLVLTRDRTHRRAVELSQLPGVEFLDGTFTDEKALEAGFATCDAAWVNLNGFASGEAGELFWGMRVYELARAPSSSCQFYIWANLDYGLKKGSFEVGFRCGHYDGKGRVGEWVLQQPQSPMATAVFTTGPYFEMAVHVGTPMSAKVVDGVVEWRVPLGEKGAVPHIALVDIGKYVLWMFENPGKAAGKDLEVATAHVDYAEMAKAFEEYTGHPARYVDVGMQEYFAAFPRSDLVLGPQGMTVKENFTGFWNLWSHSGGNKGVVRRDYKLLDDILPDRIKSAAEYFRSLGTPEEVWEMVQPEKQSAIMKNVEEGKSVF